VSHLRGRLRAGLLAVALAAAGCATGESAVREWSATASVDGNRVTITVDVPGWTQVVDYHTHLSLDGGPEAMAYAATYSFARLRPGRHTVTVSIADPQHKPIPGMLKTLEFDILAE